MEKIGSKQINLFYTSVYPYTSLLNTINHRIDFVQSRHINSSESLHLKCIYAIDKKQQQQQQQQTNKKQLI